MSNISLLNMVNSMILASDKPLEGDYISLDEDGNHPSDYTSKDEQIISWYCAQVIEIKGGEYRVSYDDGYRWYKFEEFDTPRRNKDGLTNTYPAFPPIS